MKMSTKILLIEDDPLWEDAIQTVLNNEGYEVEVAKSIKQADVIAYDDLGAEALRRLEVEDFPAIVVNDIYGGDAYEDGGRKYSRE